MIDGWDAILKAVIDTNVIVAASLSRHPDSATIKVLSALVEGKAEFLVPDEIPAEYREVLSRPKFRFDAERIASVVRFFEELGKSTLQSPYEAPMPDEKDRVFYEVALSEQDAKLVIGNLRDYPATPIVVTPAQFCELLEI